jgi:hypothetical protein
MATDRKTVQEYFVAMDEALSLEDPWGGYDGFYTPGETQPRIVHTCTSESYGRFTKDLFNK